MKNHSKTKFYCMVTAEVIALKERGLGVRAIGRELNVPASTVSLMLRAQRTAILSNT